jgi:hypothetical protein
MADWIDQTRSPAFGRREDSVYRADPPHLTANMPVTRAGAPGARGFGAERCRLGPTAALPVGFESTSVRPRYRSTPERKHSRVRLFRHLADRRKEACFPTLEDLRGSLGDEEFNKVKNSLTESSSYFRATVWVTIGTTQFTLYSLLARGGGGPGGGAVRPALRSFGSE